MQVSSQQVSSSTSRRSNVKVEQAQASGMIRKQEALARREEFKAAKLEISSSSQVDGKVMSTSEIAALNAKREEMIRKEVEKIQNESKMMMDRYLEECKRRSEMLQKEEEMRVSEERAKQELMKQRLLEHL